MNEYQLLVLKRRETAFILALKFADHPNHYPHQYTVHNAIDAAKEIHKFLTDTHD